MCTDALPEFSGSAVLYSTALPEFSKGLHVPEARELYSGADSITSLCSGKNSSKPELLVVRRGNPVASTGMGGAILLPQLGGAILLPDKGNPVATAGLTRAILLPQQSCCHSRIDKGNPVAAAGLTAGRVSGEKKHSLSDTARTASLTDLRRWPGDGFFGMKPNSGSDAMGSASLPELVSSRKTHHRASAEGLGAMLSSQHRSQSVFFHPAVNPGVGAGLLTQSWRGNRIAPPNPAVATGLLHPILLWQQDCHCPGLGAGLLHPFLC